MRLISILAIETEEYIKKCSEWKIQDEYNDDRIQISNFINFVKLKLFSGNRLIQETFEAYKMNPDNLKLAGMFELCVELILNEKADLRKELETKVQEIKQIELRHVEAARIKAEQEKKAAQIIETKKDIALTTEKISVLIYWDFSTSSELALNYALKLSEILKLDITLVHFCEKGKEHMQAINQLRILVQKIYDKHSITLHAKIKDKTSDITSALEAAVDVDALFIFIGAKGYSKELNIVAGSHTPFIVVQSPLSKPIKKIVFPVDDTVGTKQKLTVAKSISEIFPVKFIITKPAKIDIDAISTKVMNNYYFIESYFRQNKISYELLDISETSNFIDSIIIASKKIDADLLLITPKESASLSGYVLSSDEKKLIDNINHIPIVFANTKHGIVQNLGAGVIY